MAKKKAILKSSSKKVGKKMVVKKTVAKPSLKRESSSKRGVPVLHHDRTITAEKWQSMMKEMHKKVDTKRK